MKPLLIFEFSEHEYEPKRADQFDEYVRTTEFLKDYNVIVLWGGKARVYHHWNPFKYYYQKLRAWVILKIWKNNTF